MYYKVTWTDDDFTGDCFFIEADSLKEAKRIIKEEHGLGREVNHRPIVSIKEAKIDEMIENEQKLSGDDMLNEYISLKYDFNKLSVKEFSKIIKEIESDEIKYLEMMKSVRRYYRIRKVLLKECDLTKYTVEEFLKVVKELWETEDESVFQEKYNSLKNK